MAKRRKFINPFKGLSGGLSSSLNNGEDNVSIQEEEPNVDSFSNTKSSNAMRGKLIKERLLNLMLVRWHSLIPKRFNPVDAFPGDIVIFSRVLNLLRDGEVIIDTAAGVLGIYDPRPVQNDNLFPVFSVSKGITAGMLHWLVDNEKLKLDENFANIWPKFGSSRKDQIKVHHVLNHTSGLHNALADLRGENAMLAIN
ncbi:hypothetical protein ACFE04_020879 [Oxalis oulophora]